jgi:hypothetical protein
VRWLLLLLSLGALAACDGGGSTCGVSGGGPPGGAGGGVPPDVPVVLVGQPVSLDFAVGPRFDSCTQTGLNPSSVEVEVVDPSNLPVDATASAPAPGSDGLTHSSVTFTPATPGPYHVTTRFEPGFGIVQKDLLAAVDKQSAGTQLSLDRRCQAVDFDSDTVLCLAQPDFATLRGGVTVATVPAESFGFSGDTLWTTTPGELAVYRVGSDGSLQPVASVALASPDAPRVLAQTGRALLLGATQTQEARLSADGGVSLGLPLALTLTDPHAQWVPDVGLELTDSTAGHCSFSQAGGAFDGGCAAGQVVDLGADDEAVWWYDLMGASIGSVEVLSAGWQAGQPRAALGSLEFISGTQVPTATSLPLARSAPFLYTGGPSGSPTRLYLPRFTAAGVILEQYALVDPTVPHGADSKHVWSMSGTTLTWWPR